MNTTISTEQMITHATNVERGITPCNHRLPSGPHLDPAD